MSDERSSEDPSLPDSTLTYRDADQSSLVQEPDAEARYELGDEHARGGIGRIVRARDRRLGRVVAIKELLHPGPRARARFEREAHITARLEHPAIVPVHDAGRSAETGRPYYAMKLVSGRVFKEALADAHSLEERLALLPNVISVAEAIGYAHSVGIIHRDLKPSNILVGGFGETVVVDWGLAKELGTDDDDEPVGKELGARDADDLTVAGSVLGTPAFMAPEQARGEPLDERGDVYALGAILYQLLSGTPPYEGDSDSIIRKVQQTAPPPLRVLAPAAPNDLVTIVAKAMARDPGSRYPDGAALATELRRFRDGQLVRAHDYSWAQLAARWARQHRALAFALVVFIVVALFGAGWFLHREQGLRENAEAQRDIAQTERARADRQTLVLLEQTGRRELDAGKPFRAAPYLAEALRRAPQKAGPRFLLSQSLRAMRAHERSFSGHTHDVVGVDLSPDAQRVLTGSTDGSARIWDRASGRELHRLVHGGPIEAVAYSPEAGRVAVGGAGRTSIWNAATGDKLADVGLSGYRLAFSADGARLAIGSKSSQVAVLDITAGTLGPRWKHTDGRIKAVVWHPDDRRIIAVVEDGAVFVVTPEPNPTAQLFAKHAEPLSWATLSPDGGQLLVSTYGSDYYIHALPTGKLIARRGLPDGTRINHAEFRPDGRTALLAAINGIVRVVHVRSGAILAAFDTREVGRINRAAVSSDGTLAATVGVRGSVDTWRLDNLGYRVRHAGEGSDAGYISALHWLQNGKLLSVGSYDGRTEVRDGATDQVLHAIRVDSSVKVQSLDPSGTRLVNSGAATPEPLPGLWDIHTGELLARFDAHTKRVYHNDASLDGALVATAGGDGQVRQWDFRTGEPVGPVLHSKDDARFSAVAYGPGGVLIAASSDDGTVALWDRETGVEKQRFEAHKSWIEDLEFTPSGEKLITVGRLDLTAKVWTLSTGAAELDFAAHRGNVLSVNVSPNGRWFATTGTDNELNLWDIETGELLWNIPGPRRHSAFHPTRDEVVTGGPDGYIVSWAYQPDARPALELVAEAMRRSPWMLRDGELVRRR